MTFDSAEKSSAEDKKRKTEKIAQSIFFIYVFSDFFILKLNSIFLLKV